MRDGLYQVTRGSVTAGFVVGNGRVTPTEVGDMERLVAEQGAGTELLEPMQVRRVDDFYRVVVTGSRDYQDSAQVERDLEAPLAKFGCRPDQVVVVNGMARGLDNIARTAAIELGMRVEDHPAHWDQHGTAAGLRRNAEMVASTTRLPAKISEFRGQHRFLSSYDRRPVVYDGVRYPSREHAFHAAKTFGR